jgi:hypothetical protein
MKGTESEKELTPETLKTLRGLGIRMAGIWFTVSIIWDAVELYISNENLWPAIAYKALKYGLVTSAFLLVFFHSLMQETEED